MLRKLRDWLESVSWHFTNLTGNSSLSWLLRKIFPVLRVQEHSGVAVVPFFLLIPFLVAGPSFEFGDSADFLLAVLGIAAFALILRLAGLESRPLRIFSSPLGRRGSVCCHFGVRCVPACASNLQ